MPLAVLVPHAVPGIPAVFLIPVLRTVTLAPRPPIDAETLDLFRMRMSPGNTLIDPLSRNPNGIPSGSRLIPP